MDTIYALHFGSSFVFKGATERAIQQALEDTPYPYDAVFVEGDSFVEWGEPAGTDPLHVVVVFTATGPLDAFTRGTEILATLVKYGNGVVNLAASCTPDGSTAHEPFAISLHSDWGCTVGRGGAHTGDMLGWEHASA